MLQISEDISMKKNVKEHEVEVKLKKTHVQYCFITYKDNE